MSNTLHLRLTDSSIARLSDCFARVSSQSRWFLRASARRKVYRKCAVSRRWANNVLVVSIVSRRSIKHRSRLDQSSRGKLYSRVQTALTAAAKSIEAIIQNDGKQLANDDDDDDFNTVISAARARNIAQSGYIISRVVSVNIVSYNYCSRGHAHRSVPFAAVNY